MRKLLSVILLSMVCMLSAYCGCHSCNNTGIVTSICYSCSGRGGNYSFGEWLPCMNCKSKGYLERECMTCGGDAEV